MSGAGGASAGVLAAEPGVQLALREMKAGHTDRAAEACCGDPIIRRGVELELERAIEAASALEYGPPPAMRDAIRGCPAQGPAAQVKNFLLQAVLDVMDDSLRVWVSNKLSKKSCKQLIGWLDGICGLRECVNYFAWDGDRRVKCEKLPRADEALAARVAQLQRVLEAADELAAQRAAAQAEAAAAAAAAAAMPGAEAVPTPAPAAGAAALEESRVPREPLRALPAPPATSFKQQQKQPAQQPVKAKRPLMPSGKENTPAACVTKRQCLQLPKSGGLPAQVAVGPPQPPATAQQQCRSIRSIR